MVVAATGFFDGVHSGHRSVLQVVKDIACKDGAESAVITFWPHPRTVLQQDASDFRLLNSLDEKRRLVFEFGIDRFFVLPFTKDFSRIDTETFLKDYIKEQFGVSTLVVGYDHRLGKNSPSTPEAMVELSKSIGLDAVSVSEYLMDEHKVSSTRIRHVLEEGDVEMAAAMLGYDYSLHGVVVSGDRIGKAMLGFPTANMQLYEPLKLVPANGVYAVMVHVLGKEYFGMCNVGTRPTIGACNARTIETNIFDFDEDIYGMELRIEFIRRIRPEMKFPSMELLKMQIGKDKQTATRLCHDMLHKNRVNKKLF